MKVRAQAGEERPGKAANGKQANEAEGIEHGRGPVDGRFVERGGPIDHFDRRGNRDQVAEQGKGERGISGFTGDEHVVRPNQEADDRDGDARTGDKGVSEDRLSRESRNDFADYAHRGKNHDVYSRVRIEPEKMLEENGVAAHGWIEKAEVKHTLEADKEECDRDNRGTHNEDDAGGVMGPGEERKPAPRHAARAHGVDGGDELHARWNRREGSDEDADHGG